jgi:GGDEF domain-containing protein
MFKPTVLLIYNNKDKKSFIETTLQEKDFQVVSLIPEKDVYYSETEPDFLNVFVEQKIHLVLLNPGDDHLLECLTLIEFLKENPWSAPIPILVLGGRDSTFRCEVFRRGAIGVVSDPFGAEELIQLIKAVFYQMEILKPKNSVTGLPSGTMIDQEIKQRIDRRDPLAVASIMINHLQFFREKYGFDIMEEVVRELALVAKVVIHDLGSGDDFIGQMDFNNFILVSTPERVELICREMIEVFERDFKLLHYNDEDQKNSTMIYVGRDGKTRQVPLISLAIGIASNEQNPLFSHVQAIHSAQEVQRRAMKSDRSIYVKDQRILMLPEQSKPEQNTEVNQG